MKKAINILLVNMITMIRVIGVFLLLPIYIKYGGVATAILSIGCYLTDLIDGYIARKAHVSTFFGSMFDGIADKLFTLANLVLLVKISKNAILPISFEILIVIIQSIKFSQNENVQSSKVGKIKTWIIGITVISLYLITDIKNVPFITNNIIDIIMSVSRNVLIGWIFVPLDIFEILTLISYLRIEKNEKKLELNKINIKLRNGKNIKDYFYNFSLVWLNHDFYIAYKDSAQLKDIRKYLKNNR